MNMLFAPCPIRDGQSAQDSDHFDQLPPAEFLIFGPPIQAWRPKMTGLRKPVSRRIVSQPAEAVPTHASIRPSLQRVTWWPPLVPSSLAGLWFLLGLAVGIGLPLFSAWGDDTAKPPLADPLTAAERSRADQEWSDIISRQTEKLASNPKDINALSARGDALFFRGEFTAAVKDYNAMVTVNAELDASHWRRGIALFFAEDYATAADQFERYHSFDDVDRENGIWRYLCQVKAHGKARAREGLLKYAKDDRPPFPAVYQLFAGKTTGAEILTGISSATLTDAQREQQLFYAQLYIGLNEAIEGRAAEAQAHLAEATRNRWPRTAGYGPHYMWQVGRLYEAQLRQTLNAATKAAPPN
jgi:lipoprotein NlpI